MMTVGFQWGCCCCCSDVVVAVAVAVVVVVARRACVTRMIAINRLEVLS
jgi:hypothetical protein